MEMLDPQEFGACPHCGCAHLPGDTRTCDITETLVQMAADYVAAHPGADGISVAQGISPGNITKGYRAWNEAVARGLIQWIDIPVGHRLFPAPDPDDPFPLEIGKGHEPFPRPGDVITGKNGYSVKQGAWSPSVLDETRFPLSGHCAVCAVSIGRAAPWTGWHHCGQNCRECYPAKFGFA